MAKSRYKVEPIDLAGIRTYPLDSRPSKVTADDFAKPPTSGSSLKDFLDGLPNVLAARELSELAELIREAKLQRRAIIVGMGGHVIKTGLAAILIDLMQRGYITSFVMNAHAMIKHVETAVARATSRGSS